ncbi:hypothetical protein GPJ56_007187 [Histomonas meleagridis]|uniref:uncharacterized protein n=1 Tax=Histomonas meleagridis TaxID=135588 RepID=UPI00355A1C0E|nr:hypothetical protein GPJ56_007187 [Histomonas meleagridis]KAH0800111.1 hypothetical protein GO595_007223 [Histomonas meleagridis]
MSDLDSSNLLLAFCDETTLSELEETIDKIEDVDQKIEKLKSSISELSKLSASFEEQKNNLAKITELLIPPELKQKTEDVIDKKLESYYEKIKDAYTKHMEDASELEKKTLAKLDYAYKTELQIIENIKNNL